MAELKALNGCIVQASEEAVPRLLAAGFVRVGDTAPLERERPTPRRTAKKAPRG